MVCRAGIFCRSSQCPALVTFMNWANRLQGLELNNCSPSEYLAGGGPTGPLPAFYQTSGLIKLGGVRWDTSKHHLPVADCFCPSYGWAPRPAAAGRGPGRSLSQLRRISPGDGAEPTTGARPDPPLVARAGNGTSILFTSHSFRLDPLRAPGASA